MSWAFIHWSVLSADLTAHLHMANRCGNELPLECVAGEHTQISKPTINITKNILWQTYWWRISHDIIDTTFHNSHKAVVDYPRVLFLSRLHEQTYKPMHSDAPTVRPNLVNVIQVWVQKQGKWEVARGKEHRDKHKCNNSHFKSSNAATEVSPFFRMHSISSRTFFWSISLRFLTSLNSCVSATYGSFALSHTCRPMNCSPMTTDNSSHQMEETCHCLAWTPLCPDRSARSGHLWSPNSYCTPPSASQRSRRG